MAVERMRGCAEVKALAAELGVHRRLLYWWRDRLAAPVETGTEPAARPPSGPQQQIAQLKELLAEKTLEADFFKSALQKVEARRQRNGKAGETASTTKSGS
jgi:transposase-like protein